MNKRYFISLLALNSMLFILFTNQLKAQSADCFFKDTLFSIDFGAGKYLQEFNLNSLKNYRRDYTSCPNDGFYSYSSSTGGCFNGDWLTIGEDHTPNDVDGKMMLVNASEKGGGFFIATLAGFKPSTNYEFGVWMLNVCKINGGCQPLPPDIQITLETTTGRKVCSFQSGRLYQASRPFWKRYYGLFTTPADATTLILKMDNSTTGGCGNDFALDDITIRECYPPPALEIKIPPNPPPTAVPVVITKKIVPELKLFKKNTQQVNNDTVKDSLIHPSTITIERRKTIPIPIPLLTRKNPVVKQIESGDGEINIEVYDNGEIDGDTVSIYHNNELIVSRKGLSEKPIRFTITVNPSEPYHEIVMVAENLGSIPPNTSLMIVTANGKRYETFISSSEEQNAKVIISRKVK